MLFFHLITVLVLQFFQPSISHLTAVANGLMVMVLMTPSEAFLRLPLLKLRPAIPSFAFLNRKKLTGSGFSQLGGFLRCWLAAISSLLMPTPSSFWSSFRNLGTHLADFLERPG